MTTSEILNLDYYKGKNENIFQKALRKIKPFKNIPLDENIDLELLEKLVATYEYKYAFMINYICPVYIPGERRMYSATIRNTNTKEISDMVFASSLYELYCKICILYYSKVINGFELKNWNDVVENENKRIKGIKK